MHRIGYVAIVVVAVIIVYLIMLVVMPVVRDLISTANATVTGAGGWGNYPGSQGFLISVSWILWFVPGCIGTIAIIIILRAK